MTAFKTIARTSTALCVAALLGAGVAAAQPADAGDDGMQWLRALDARGEALNAQHGLGETGAAPAEACRTVGTPMSLERSLCYRAAASQVSERFTGSPGPSMPVARPIVISGSGFDWADASIGFGAAAGLALLGAGSVVALRSRRTGTAPM